MRILIATTQVPFVRGGAEILAEGLLNALERAGHEAEIVRFPFKWYPAEAIPPQVLSVRLMDLTDFMATPIDRIIGLKFPAYLIPHPNKSYWILHQHRAAYDLWDSGISDLLHSPHGRTVRDFIRQTDEQFLAESRGVFTISKNVSNRLARFNGIASEPLYHPPAGAERYVAGPYGDYLLFPSRISGLKRHRLVIEALATCRRSLRVVFVGGADNQSELEQLKLRARELGLEQSVTWTGPVSEDDKIRLYADACAVIYPPVDEDYGYVTLEAMLAAKPVITCTDSGGPLEFVQHEVTGVIADPVAESLGCAMQRLWDDRKECHALGHAAREAYDALDITWSRIVERLCASP